jgi:hypothetical protein
MKISALVCGMVLIGTGYALAAHKGQPLDDATCRSTWSMVSPNGARISKDRAGPYIIDFSIVDTDHDGTVDANEFTAACQAGWIKGQ